MEKRHTILRRFLSDTPEFFKRTQLFGLSLAGLGTSLTQVNGIPGSLCTILISSGSTIAIVAQFAVKQTDTLNNSTYDKTK